jgi:hypothetical protein
MNSISIDKTNFLHSKGYQSLKRKLRIPRNFGREGRNSRRFRHKIEDNSKLDPRGIMMKLCGLDIFGSLQGAMPGCYGKGK